MTHFNTIKYSEIVFRLKKNKQPLWINHTEIGQASFFFFCTAYIHGNIEIYIQDTYDLRTFYQIQIAWKCNKAWRDESQIIKS